MVSTQSQLLSKEIYLIDRLNNPREPMRHLKCVCFLRPTPSSINRIIEELREKPCYGDYYIYFSNSLKKSDIERLAEADEFEVVREVQVSRGSYSEALCRLHYAYIFTKTTWTNTQGILCRLSCYQSRPLFSQLTTPLV